MKPKNVGFSAAWPFLGSFAPPPPAAPEAQPVKSPLVEPPVPELKRVDGRLAFSWQHGQRVSAVQDEFRVPGGLQAAARGSQVLVPLRAEEVHVIEIEYQDVRPLRDLSFTARHADGTTEEFRGDRWREMEARDGQDLRIRRESSHNAPITKNPVKVKVEMVTPEGEVIYSKNKHVDSHVHDTGGNPDAHGYPEKDNVNRDWDALKTGALPEGTWLRLTPFFDNEQPWETARETVCRMIRVSPVYLPAYQERVRIHQATSWEAIDPNGYAVDPDRKIAGVLVRWTDHGGIRKGAIRFQSGDTTHRTRSDGVGSGELQLFAGDNLKATDGKIFVDASGVQVKEIEVLYAD